LHITRHLGWYLRKFFVSSLTLSKDTLKENGTSWLIKCLVEWNIGDVEHFNKPLHVCQLIVKHVDNNWREMLIIAGNLWLWYHVEVHEPINTFKRCLKKEWDIIVYNVPIEWNFNDVGHSTVRPSTWVSPIYLVLYEYYVIVLCINHNSINNDIKVNCQPLTPSFCRLLLCERTVWVLWYPQDHISS